MRTQVIMGIILTMILASLFGCSSEVQEPAPVSNAPSTEVSAPSEPSGPEPAGTKADEPEPANQEVVEQEALTTPDTAIDSCSGELSDKDITCIDRDGDGQISRNAIELVGRIKDSRKTLFFDGNSFFMESDGKEYKVTLRKDKDFRLEVVPKEEIGLCGIGFEMVNDKRVAKFNPGSSHKTFSDAEHCLERCGVEKESSDQPSFDQQSCILDCGIEVCQS